jgi:hypothetical protein
MAQSTFIEIRLMPETVLGLEYAFIFFLLSIQGHLFLYIYFSIHHIKKEITQTSME